MTQEALAWESGLNKAYLSQVESGKRAPSVPVLAALAKRLGVELADLVAVNPRSVRLRLLEAVRRREFSTAEKLMGALREATDKDG